MHVVHLWYMHQCDSKHMYMVFLADLPTTDHSRGINNTSSDSLIAPRESNATYLQIGEQPIGKQRKLLYFLIVSVLKCCPQA